VGRKNIPVGFQRPFVGNKKKPERHIGFGICKRYGKNIKKGEYKSQGN
jgi:hypothetical protein